MRATSALLLTAAATLALSACQKKSDEAKAPDAAAPAATAAAPAAPAPTTPIRKAGLWEVRTSTASESEGTPQVMRMCTSAEVEKRISILGLQITKGACSRSQMSRQPDSSWVFDSTCDMGTGGVTRSHAVLTGDLSRHYQARIEMTTSGAATPQMNRPRVMTQDATWLGACPADMRAGDASMMTAAGTMKINLLDMLPPGQ